MKDLLIEAILKSITTNWDIPALADFHGKSFSYGELATRIAHLHLFFKGAGIKQGDKIALCAKNSAEWGAIFLACITYGAVAVPLLHEFHVSNVAHLVAHSEAKLLFADKNIADNLDLEKMPGVDGIVIVGEDKLFFSRNNKVAEAMASVNQAFAKAYPRGYTAADVHYTQPESDALALINYTSGSMGNSKGVMLSYANIWSNIRFALDQIPFLRHGDGMLSMLPLAHMYGLAFEFIFPLCKGCHITFLGRVPSPKIVLEAFREVRPQLVITVPLVIDKIVKTRVFPVLKKPAVKILLHLPGVRQLIHGKIRRQLLDAFGGELKELVLGGAPLSTDVEEFLRKIKFPFTIGYGMTECAPLVTYEWWATQRPHSCGRPVDGMQVRVESPDPEHQAGLLYVKGDNVMMGYFKNPKATEEALTKDGWLNTGDMCTIDKDGYLYIRGRQKSMILGPSGQNIYPEEIEGVLNELPLVAESVAVEREGRIVAIVHPDYDAARKLGLTEAQTDEKVKALLPKLNSQLPAYSRVSEIEILTDELEKTPKHSIRRYIYK